MHYYSQTLMNNNKKLTREKTPFTWSTLNNNQHSPNNNKKSAREKTLFTWSTLISLSAKLIPSCKLRFIFLPKNIQTSPVFYRILKNAEHKKISWPGPAVLPFYSLSNYT